MTTEIIPIRVMQLTRVEPIEDKQLRTSFLKVKELCKDKEEILVEQEGSDFWIYK